jgi:hypothetical protein
MANALSTDKQVAIISALAEGSGIRQIERMTGVHRYSIMRLGVRVGKGCISLMDGKMRDLLCENLQFDEWSHDTDNPKKPKRHVTVLHFAPITSPEATVRAHIVREFRLVQES